MPNWVRNRLTIRGPQYKEVLHQITSFDNEEHKVVLDFNKITPMPESIAKMESSSRVPTYINLFLNSIKKTDEFKKYISIIVSIGENYIGMKDDEFKEKLKEIAEEKDWKGKKRFDSEQAVLDYGRMALDNILNYGVVDWYDWSIRNWGTKWNARETVIEDNVILFDTAWSPVPELMRKLSSMFPENLFEYDFSEEQIWVLCGEYEFEKGDCTKEIIFDEGSKEAYEKGFELWPDSKRYYNFDKKKNTYYYIEDFEDSGME